MSNEQENNPNKYGPLVLTIIDFWTRHYTETIMHTYLITVYAIIISAIRNFNQYSYTNTSIIIIIFLEKQKL